MLDNLRELIKEWKEEPHFEESDRGRFVLMILLKEGPLTLQDLEEKSFIFISQFGFKHDHVHRKPKEEEFINIKEELDNLVAKDMVAYNDTNNKYSLTDTGTVVAQESVTLIERGAHWVKKNVLTPGAAARNTMIADCVLAVIKLGAGLLSGSVGLLADGADAAVDTFSASAVWVGMKCNKELLGTVVIVIMMMVTGVSIGYESVTKMYAVYQGTVTPMGYPYIVILVEGIALVAAVFLCFYQGFIGREYGSLALLSQSIDSKNHIYVAGAVIAGAVSSIFGIYFVDAVIGVYVSFKILYDGHHLIKEVISSAQGEETDFSKYGVLFEKYWLKDVLNSYRTWVLYRLKERDMNTSQLIDMLEKTFKHTYVPILSEFGIGAATHLDFEESFDELMQPLLDEQLVDRDDGYSITEKGREHIQSILKGMRYHHLV
ncbi:MAG: cation transporter [Candidatus Methanofastidiosia archaeon]|jgi:predicted transcriptional regulator